MSLIPRKKGLLVILPLPLKHGIRPATPLPKISVLVLEADRNAPAISIHTPASEEEFNPDDAIRLQAHVTDDSALDEVTVWVTPEEGMPNLGHTVNSADYNNDGREAEIDEAIRLDSGTPQAGSYILTLRAIDEHGNTAKESITIYIRKVDTHAPAPAITITNPVDGAAYSSDETIALRVEVIDNLVLASVTISLTPRR